MFDVIITLVVFTSVPVNIKLSLEHAVSDDVKRHVHCSGTHLFYVVEDYSHSCSIVCSDWSRGLKMSQTYKRPMYYYTFYQIFEHGA